MPAARHLGVERVLIICPTSLKHQWEREIERFTDRSVQVIGGLQPMRQMQFRTPAFFKIMNYDTVHADLDLIRAWEPELVILDEAQRIKNWNTRVARSVKRIDSPYAIVLTGTPLENRLEELVSIVQFVDRFRLGPTYRLMHDHQVTDEHGKVVGYRDLDRIGKTLEPVLLRRRKDMVLSQLPKRIDNNIFVPMTPQQGEMHAENRDIVARIVYKWRMYKFLSEADQRRLMIALQNMRMSCDSTYLLDQETDHGVKADELMTTLDELLEDPTAKVVIFSQWLRMHELIVERLEERKLGHVLFHGGVPGQQRKSLVDRFRDEPDCRIFLATDAGGVGLNLQFASVVINMDLPWNPAVLEQRIGRVHRLGQQRPVQAINFVAQGTIEEGMLGVLQFKKSLFAGVLDGGEKEVFLGGSRLTKFMETVEKTTTAIPQPRAEDEYRSAPQLSAAQRTRKPVAPAQVAAADPWAGLMQAGLDFVKQLASGAPRQDNGHASKPAIGVVRDERTGEQYVKLPLPTPEILGQLTQALGGLLGMLQGVR
ncbi:MAG: DEAD/DEAH box helicase [Gemmataceae bacterium]